MSDLDARSIEAALSELGAARGPGRPVHVMTSTASTNDDAQRAAREGAAHGAAFLADSQTAGRGRRGHTWHSPAGENLYLSVVLRPRLEPAAIAAVTLAIGVAVARVIERVLRPGDVWVKWPNDVLGGPGKRKLAGVLVEAQLRGAEIVSLVAGVGVNVHAASFPEEIAARATSLRLLSTAATTIDRSTLAARLIVEIERATRAYEEDRLASFRDDLARLDSLRGSSVDVGGVRGIAEGVDEEGRLLVRAPDGEIARVVAGEVTPWARG